MAFNQFQKICLPSLWIFLGERGGRGSLTPPPPSPLEITVQFQTVLYLKLQIKSAPQLTLLKISAGGGEECGYMYMNPSLTGGTHVCYFSQSEFQNQLFCILRRIPSHCQHFTIVFATVLFTVTFSTHLGTSFLTILSQSFLSHCFKAMLLVGILPLQGLCISQLQP